VLSTLSKLLLLTTLLAHAVFGCCLHHQHQHQAQTSHNRAGCSSTKHSGCSHSTRQHPPAKSH